ncbi:MAG: hypothetical protein C0490_23675, partial [Marivirga sp.]|nr:hypothetical protein [Marivirga sp.]
KSVLVGLEDLDTLSHQGCLAEQFEEDENVEYHFMASEILVNSNNKDKYALIFYVFKRINEDTALEILMHRNSDFSNRVRLIIKYNFQHFQDAVRSLNLYKKEYEDGIIESSTGMK